MFEGPFDHSIIKRAKEKGLVQIEYVNIRDFGLGKHKIVDDTPYGGGVGMVIRVDVVHKAIQYAKQETLQQFNNLPAGRQGKTIQQFVVLTSASGKKFIQKDAKAFSKLDHLIIICGHYEGIDERIKNYIDAEISIGDFVVTGGELPAMLITDAVTRLIPDVITEGATENESFSYIVDGKTVLEYPQYTKPQNYDGQSVPEILLNGNHQLIEKWRKEKALEKTNNF